MPYYRYVAIDVKGAVQDGMAAGADSDEVRERISASGAYIVSMRETSNLAAHVRRLIYEKGVKRSEIIEFAKNLSVMLKAGIPLFTALSDVANTIENRYFKQVVISVRRMIEQGGSFSEAAAAHKDVFPGIFIRIIGVGEETGRIERSLDDLANHLQKMEDLAAAVKRALMYPIFAIVATLGALVFWLVYVLPKITDVFKDMGIALPLPTRMLIFASSAFRSYWYVILILAAVVAAAVKLVKRNKRLQSRIDMAKLKFPVLKHIVYNKLLAVFSEQMRILVMAGIPIDRALRIISDVMENVVFSDAVENVRADISLGSRISDSIGRQKVFPALLHRMVEIGETSGSLDEQFSFLSEHYTKRLDDVADKMSKTIEPIVISVIGGLFAVIIMGLMLPIYDLLSKAG